MVAKGLQPDSRPVPVGAGQQAPYWAAGPQYGGYAGGYYSSFGNVLPALMVGTMLGRMFSGPTVIHTGDGGPTRRPAVVTAAAGSAAAATSVAATSAAAAHFGGGDF